MPKTASLITTRKRDEISDQSAPSGRQRGASEGSRPVSVGRPEDMQRHALYAGGSTTMSPSERENFDLLDELELLLQRKGRLSVLMVTFIALAVCFLVVGLLMATGIMMVTFFIFICYNETPDTEGIASLNILGYG
uniref:Uncharacterized protein n=1 Tax=Anopheles minimus TaxID=112268 RepID=A0A182VY75_9DIPT